MYKFIVITLIIFSASILLALNSNNLIYKTSANAIPTVTPTPDSPSKNISIELDKDSVSPRCPPGYRPFPGRTCGDGMLITVIVTDKSENDALIYKYRVSGGRIIGEGAKITWDLSGAAPGTYTITVDVENESKTQSPTETKTVTVFDHCCNGDCFCPEISVSVATTPTLAGEEMIFVANVSGGSGDDVSYNWTISKGKIIKGQGTPTIKVATNSKMAGNALKATVNFDGEIFCGGVCIQTASANGFVAAKKRKKK